MKYKAEIIAFTTGSSLMIIELVGSRIVAPYLGTSIFIWTSIIGVIMAFLSAGYWYGGKLADSGANEKGLSLILLISSTSTSLILLLEPFLKYLSTVDMDIRIASTIASVFLFGPIAFTIALISPYLIKLKIRDTATSGQTVGSLYAVSTMGSIVGTFLGGFFLISYLGTSNIIILVACVLLLLSFVVYSKNYLAMALAVALIASNFLFPNRILAVADIDTHYNRWLIVDAKEYRTGRPIRHLLNNTAGAQSGIYLDNPKELLFFYLRTFDLVFNIKTDIKNALLLGAGAYTYPAHVNQIKPELSLDIVEIDPELQNIAKKYFAYEDYPNMEVFEMDARVFINKNNKKYDVAFIDVFSSELSIPHHITTRETAQRLRTSLSDDGVAVINVISAISGKNSKFLSAFYKTYAEFFPEVLVVPVYPGMDEDLIQNITFFAFAKKPTIAEMENIKSKFAPWTPHPTDIFSNSDIPILTDEFAPVEKYISGFIKEF